MIDDLPFLRSDLPMSPVFVPERRADVLPSGEFRVSDEGSIIYPLLGSLKVSGMDVPAIAALIRQSLGKVLGQFRYLRGDDLLGN